MIFVQIQTPDWCGLLRFAGWWTGAWIATCCVLLEVLQYRVSRSTGTQFTLYVRSQWRYLSFPIKHRNIDINCTTYHGFSLEASHDFPGNSKTRGWDSGHSGGHPKLSPIFPQVLSQFLRVSWSSLRDWYERRHLGLGRWHMEKHQFW